MPAIVRLMRPHQWVKNLFVVAPLVFAKELGNAEKGCAVAMAFGLFCLISSAIYVLNDLVDIEADRAHPTKRNRPLPSGKVSEKTAKILALGLASTAIGLSFFLGHYFTGALVGYGLLNLAYSFFLKRIPYVDVLSIATGFELRVLGGAFAADVFASRYLLVVTATLALFLGFGKRLHELVATESERTTRHALRLYRRDVLTVLFAGAGLATIAIYVIYTLDSSTIRFFGTHYLWASAPLAAVGILRFVFLVAKKGDSESPTEKMLKDPPFLINLALWAVLMVGLVYLGLGA